MKVVVSRFIEDDLEEIASYIALDNPTRALSFIREIREKFRQIGAGPLQYRLRPEIGPTARMAIHGRYVILFHVVADAVRIERVVHGARELGVMFHDL
ncbi:toxin ParE1/3/4 [Granulicella rosea]|uniref:Toxin ParE1/3/4 n=1 Tax=Granulicella rosea TaxID=474952 RepID=A0A239IDU6_9BACT|nr:type II toxin-antitoxin system RelE/ParE family toxin [Granulicella rosea]SNS91735.1 toxin ParE1/3/4 [Granulicella rosea]